MGRPNDAPPSAGEAKVAWRGQVLGVQPRIRLMRSFDERQHTYVGFLLLVQGDVAGVPRDFRVAVGPAAQAKHGFRAGDELSGTAVPASPAKEEVADLHRAAGFRFAARGADAGPAGPPFLGPAPTLPEYRARGHRRLHTGTYAASCTACRWGCEMPVELIVDNWGKAPPRYRRETFCYGPKSCPNYTPGPARKVPGRRRASWTEEDWVDEDATAHRGPDD